MGCNCGKGHTPEAKAHSYRQNKIQNHVQNCRTGKIIQRGFCISKGTQDPVSHIVHQLGYKAYEADAEIQKGVPHGFGRTGQPQKIAPAQNFSQKRKENARHRRNDHRCGNGVSQFFILPRSKEPGHSRGYAHTKAYKEIDMDGQHQPGHPHRRKTESAAKPSHHSTVRDIVKLQHQLHKEKRRCISQQLPMDGAYVHAHLARNRFFRGPG